MRFILESWVQAYYIDLNYTQKSLVDKIDLLKEKEKLKGEKKRKNWYGLELFERAFLDHKYSAEIYNFFRDLCNHTHSSYAELKRLATSSSIQDTLIQSIPHYNKEYFELNLKFFHQLHKYLMRMLDALFVKKL